MKTYKEHYEYCRSLYTSNKLPKYKSVYDLRVDTDFLDKITTPEYYILIKKIRSAINSKISKDIRKTEWPYEDNNNPPDSFIDRNGHAIRVNNWFDISELEQLAQLIMPIIEKDILGCNGKIEFLHPYRNIPHKGNETSSWKWHYDDCPDEFLKLFINLNEVHEESGPLRYFENFDGSVPVVKTYNTIAGIRSTHPPVYPNTRIPDKIIEEGLKKGGKVVNVTGKPGSYAICTPNIYHKASIPVSGMEPRDVLFFFIRPSIKKYKNYLENTSSYFPAKNVKMYNLD